MFNSVMIRAFEMLSASMFFRRNSSEQMVMIRQSIRRNRAFSFFAERRVRLRKFAASSVPSITSSSAAVPRYANVIFAFFGSGDAFA
jgi:hypothetical protein